MPTSPTIAVLIPCRNEEATVGKVLEDFRAHLPDADLYVIDNCSSDSTAKVAQEHGASLLFEPRQGKGFALERAFDEVAADLYVIVDGDDTYPADRVVDLLRSVAEGRADMCVGARLQSHAQGAFRPLHVFGNRLVGILVNWVSGSQLSDIMSGYRVVSRRAAERLPLVSAGFEVETDMTIQALYYRLKVVEVPVHYRSRPLGSESKLRTLRDGGHVLWKIFTLFRSLKPLTFFGSLGLAAGSAGLAAGIPAVLDYVRTGYVAHLPLAVMASALEVVAMLCIFTGIMLHSMNWRMRELHNVLTRHPREAGRARQGQRARE